MSTTGHKQSSEAWDRALELFENLLEAGNPDALLAGESNPEVRRVAAELWSRHKSAEATEFLREPPPLVMGLWEPEVPALPDGSLLINDRFLIIRLVGKGGMGEVYLARDRKLEEDVAIKTVRRKLAADPSIRRQFISEIQSARRVNHRNVCRIYDLFDDTETPFFSMEYLPGERLSEKLTAGSLSAEDRKLTALQLAEGLAELHERGLIHRDFKPGNVIFDPASDPVLRAVIMDFGLAQRLAIPGSGQDMGRAGTLSYMAPEVIAGSRATIRSDIFAFGKVLGELLPGDKWALQCQAENPAERPASLGPVIRHLRGHPDRRTLLKGLAGGLLLAYGSYKLIAPASVVFNTRQGLLLNGFSAPDRTLANTIRQLVLTALYQSSLLRLIPDESVKATLEQLKLPKDLPVERRYLRAAASQRKVPLVAEGTLSFGSSGLRLLLQLFERDSERPLLEVDESVHDRNFIVQLAEKAALGIRKGIGESGASLTSTHRPLEQATSRSAGAVEFLFQGIEIYGPSRADDALILFEKAIQIDSEFALAYAWAGVASAARYRGEQSAAYMRRAYDLRERASERDRLWIERGYFNNSGNFLEALKACQKLTVLYPDDATFQRNMAFASARIGRPQDSIAANRNAIELNPSGMNNKTELLVNLAQANRPEEALKAYEDFVAHGISNPQLDFGAGLAHLCELDYAAAAADYERMGADAESQRQARMFRCVPLTLTGRYAEAIIELKAELAYDMAADPEPYFRSARRVWLAYLYCMIDLPALAAPHIQEVLKVSALPPYIPLFREAGMAAIAAGNLPAAKAALEILKNIEAIWTSTHSSGSRYHLEALVHEAEGKPEAFDLIIQAGGLWPDPLTMSSLRDFYIKRKDWDKAWEVAQKGVYEQRGWLFKHYFPGLFTLNQIARARILKERAFLKKDMALLKDSLREYRQLLSQWRPEATTYHLGQSVRREADQVQAAVTEGVRHG